MARYEVTPCQHLNLRRPSLGGCTAPARWLGNVGNGDATVAACGKHANWLMMKLADRARRVVGHTFNVTECTQPSDSEQCY